jgi:hypothetical protein
MSRGNHLCMQPIDTSVSPRSHHIPPLRASLSLQACATVPAACLQVELENWVEPARPLTQAEKERAFIIDNAIFELHPRSGRLQPGATETVRLQKQLCNSTQVVAAWDARVCTS